MNKKVHNIVLIGETGNGKSSLGNFILGSSDFEVSDYFNSCTKDTIQKISKLDPEIGVVDTPGLQDSNGEDKQNYDKMLQIFKEIKYLHFIIVVLNFQNPRFTSSIQHMLKFLCNVFPKNFGFHVGIVFTHYDHEYQLKINSKKNIKDPQECKNKYIEEIMKFIEKNTGEKTVKKPPVYFLDSYIEDDYSKKQLNTLIALAKHLEPIEDIRTNCDLRYKKTEPVTETRVEEKVEGEFIVTYYKKYERIKYTDYNDNETFGDWKLVDTQTCTRSLPVREIERKEIIYKEKESDKSDSEDSKSNDKEKEEEEGDSLLKDFISTVALTLVGGFLFKNND